MEELTIYVGLDVHQDTIDVSIAEGGEAKELRDYGTIGGDLGSIDRLVHKLEKAHGGAKLSFVYEAGPTGFVLCRHLRAKGKECEVVSPSMVPRRPGERVKTDRRDSLS